MEQNSIRYMGIKKIYTNYLYKYGIYFIFLLMIIFFSLKSKNFLSLSNLDIIMQQSAPLGIAAVGMSFILITAGIDISVGSNMYASAIIAAVALTSGVNLWVAILIAIASGTIIGIINGILVARFNIVPFITTLATMSIARGIGLTISKSKLYVLNDTTKFITSTRIFNIPVVVVILFVIVLIGDYVLRRTPFGRQLFAIGNDASAAERIGINVKTNKMMVYILCGALAGFAGLVSAGQVGNVTSNFANGNEFVVISATVLGGTSLFGGKGNIFPGAIVGIILVVTIVNGLTMINASPYAYTIVRGVIIFLAVAVDSINYKGEIR